MPTSSVPARSTSATRFNSFDRWRAARGGRAPTVRGPGGAPERLPVGPSRRIGQRQRGAADRVGAGRAPAGAGGHDGVVTSGRSSGVDPRETECEPRREVDHAREVVGAPAGTGHQPQREPEHDEALGGAIQNPRRTATQRPGGVSQPPLPEQRKAKLAQQRARLDPPSAVPVGWSRGSPHATSASPSRQRRSRSRWRRRSARAVPGCETTPEPRCRRAARRCRSRGTRRAPSSPGRTVAPSSACAAGRLRQRAPSTR